MKHQDQRRFFLKSTLEASLATMAVSSGLFAPIVHALGQIPDKVPAGKSVYEIRGEVYVDGTLANKDTLITANSTVETKSNSYIIFVVGKDAHIIRENSRVELNESNTLENGLRVLSGKILSVFGKRSRKQPTYNIRTTTATIGIRGTAVYSEAYSDYSYVCTCYGATQISANTDSSVSEQIFSEHHDHPRFIHLNPQNGKLIEPAPMINHTNQELLLLESLCKRIPPFIDSDAQY